MSKLTLVIANKNYSSWSLRPWLALHHVGVPFDEVMIPLGTPETAVHIARHSPSGRVPMLKDGELGIWDSLAIIEYLAEKFPQARLWPEASSARAIARSVSAEMHSGFAALRQNMAMNMRASLPGVGRAPGVAEDIARVVRLWTDCLERYGSGGPYLFGAFSAADCMFAPVVSRFATYAVELEGPAKDYAASLSAHPGFQAWKDAALAEPLHVARYEPASRG